jgi:glycosyltransferase involved in cell wall biosynthesis
MKGEDLRMAPELSAVVVAQNEERNIARCLASLRFADEIVVVDAYSVDATPETARRMGAKVVARVWDGFSPQKQFAIDLASGEWILLVDADEEVSSDLAREIRSVLAGDKAALPAGFRVRRDNFFMGRPMRHGPWRDDYNVRLFRKGRGVVAPRPVHEGITIDGEIWTLRAPLFHYTHQTLSESFRRLNRYTTLEASERASRRKVGLFDVAVPPLGVFMRYFMIGGCWRAGTRGFLLSAITAMYRSVLYAKTYFLQTENHVHRTPHA